MAVDCIVVVVHLVVSLATPATDPAVLAAWRERLAGRAPHPVAAPATAGP